MTLKVGDKVRLIEARDEDDRPHLGKVFAVKAVTSDCALLHGLVGHRHKNRLEKIKEPTFKVGDRVKLPDWVHTEKTGTVTHVRWGSVEVKPDGKDGWHDEAAPNTKNGAGTFVASALVKIGVPFKPEHGDKVVNLKTGREGTVLMGQVWDRDNISAQPVPVKALVEYEEHHPGTYDLIKKDAPW